ncbi:lipid A deacylase LpxR family protein [Pedobacter nyackensis]|nr:lipid A deacylase LpxR family protein [Pedobacter nyackensis]
MKRFLYLLFLLWFSVVNASFARQEAPRRLLQAYWDDDYINFYGHGTDKAYTNANKFTLFYIKKKPSNLLIERILPKAGDSSLNIFGFGLSQLIFTPNIITNPDFQPDDYPWSGSLYATYSLYSYNEKKKYNLQTELDLGVNGPASLARQAQEIAHRLVSYQQPNGWANQFGNSLVLNLNFRAEKRLLYHSNFLEVIGGGQLQAGTGINAAAAYALIRIGKMSPYFQGLMKQYSRPETGSKVQIYFIIKPMLQLVLSNAMLQGGINASRPAPLLVPGKNGTAPTLKYYQPINHIITSYAFGPVLVLNKFSVSSIQTTSTPLMKDLYGITWGNFTFTYVF